MILYHFRCLNFVTSVAGTNYPSGTPEFTLVFWWWLCYSIFFYVVFCEPLLVFHSFSLGHCLSFSWVTVFNYTFSFFLFFFVFSTFLCLDHCIVCPSSINGLWLHIASNFIYSCISFFCLIFFCLRPVSCVPNVASASWLSILDYLIRFSLMFLFVCPRTVSCVPNVAIVSGLSILDCNLRYSLTFIH
jgi:hypothetical protein